MNAEREGGVGGVSTPTTHHPEYIHPYKSKSHYTCMPQQMLSSFNTSNHDVSTAPSRFSTPYQYKSHRTCIHTTPPTRPNPHKPSTYIIHRSVSQWSAQWTFTVSPRTVEYSHLSVSLTHSHSVQSCPKRGAAYYRAEYSYFPALGAPGKDH